MKLKQYSIAAMAVSLMACGMVSHAQQTPATPAEPVTPAAPVAPMTAQGNFGYLTPAPFASLEGMNRSFGGLQDSVYRKKMEKLREQMRSLQKEMTDLQRDEQKKNNGNMQEMHLKLQEKLKAMNLEQFKNMDQKFEMHFKDFGNNFKFHFNFDSIDANLDKKIQSGEVKMKVKNYSKSYPADANDKLQIDNTYGKVTVNTWNKNEFKVDVQVKSYANEDADAQKLIDQTQITDSKSADLVTFKTSIDATRDSNGNNNWGTWTHNGKTTIRKIVINYTVYMPAKSAVSITNKYGGIVLPNLDGKVTINNSYGSLLAKTLSNTGNNINIRYGSANIGSLNGSDVDVAYGDLNLDVADKINAESRYGSVKIGKLSTSGTISLRYGNGLQIVDLDKNLKGLSVNSSYAPVKLNSASTLNADFDVTVHSGNFIYGENAVNVTNKTPAESDRNYWNATKNYKGHIGKGNAEKLITIKSNYGSVKFD